VCNIEDRDMKIEQQIGVILDVIFDVVQREEPKEHKINMIVKHCEGNDRLGDAFAEFISWFKLEEGE
jgi:hypothetical protein